MKHIFILGGSKLQLDLIFEAKRMYFQVHLFDGNSECIGKQYADYFYHINFQDKEAILAKARKIYPVAILTIATEVGNVTACYVSEKLGLLSNSYQVALHTTNKLAMKAICDAKGVNTAKYQIIKKDADLKNWNIFPLIVKPVDSSAGRGVSFHKNSEGLKDAVSNALNFSHSSELLVEEYIKGRQFSVETISSYGKHEIVTITEEYITKPPKVIETQQLVPARVNESEKAKIEAFTLEVLNSFEIQFGACHIEIRQDDKGKLFFIEIASRMGGWRSELVNFALGINYTQLLIFSALGKIIKVQRTKNDIAIVKMILDSKDLIEYKNYEENFSKNLITDLEINDVYESKHLADSNGYYFVHIQNRNQLEYFIGAHQ